MAYKGKKEINGMLCEVFTSTVKESDSDSNHFLRQMADTLAKEGNAFSIDSIGNNKLRYTFYIGDRG